MTLDPPLPLLGGGTFAWGEFLFLGGIAPVDGGDQVWVSDPRNHRVFRISDATTSPTVDIVLGQTSTSGNQCNQGRGWGSPSQDSLCQPSGMALDPYGNLYVADHALEVEGNHRLLEYDASLFPANPATALFAIPASRVFGTGGSFTGPCQSPLCGPWEPAFDSAGRMVVGFNAYIGQRFPAVYENPPANPLPFTALSDYYSMAYGATFDAQDNLYVADLNRGRVLIYWNPFSNLKPAVYLPLILK